jgi:hypothetical protein
MSTRAEIVNLAMAHLGRGKAITDIDTDDSAEAEALRRFINPVRKQLLREFNWPFAKVTATLVETDTQPTDQWAYAYSMPDECVKFHRVQSAYRVDTRDRKVPYEIVRGPTTSEIYTDQADAIGEYTVDMPYKSGDITSISVSGTTVSVVLDETLTQADVGRVITFAACSNSNNNGEHTILTVNESTNTITYTDSSATTESPTSPGTWVIDESYRMTEDFAMVYSLRLALSIAHRATGGEAGGIVARLEQLYQRELAWAKANAMNEQGWDLEQDSEFIRARE